jgi:hypothetical protein
MMGVEIMKTETSKKFGFGKGFDSFISHLLQIFVFAILLICVVFISGCVEFPETQKVSTISNDSSIQTITKNTESTTPEKDVDSIEPKKQQVDDIKNIEPVKQEIELTKSIYTETDVTNIVAEAKGLANDRQQKLSFFKKYYFEKGSSNVVVFTPYANTVMLITGMIEKYDEYTLNDVREVLNLDNVYTTAGNIKTTEMYSNWDKSDLRAVIELEEGKICRGTIGNVDTELGDFDLDNSQIYYLTSISATFNCYNEIHNRTVKFVYITGNQKTTFDIDMRKLK